MGQYGTKAEIAFTKYLDTNSSNKKNERGKTVPETNYVR